jgi:hypothetical protein
MTISYRTTLIRIFTLLAVSLLGGFLLQVAAQTVTTGDVTGTVTDASNAVVADATISLTSVDTGAVNTTKTSSMGFYRFPLMKPGNYTLSITHPGFRTARKPVAVEIGQILTANIQLEIGQTSETVEVTSAAPLLETENANLSTSYDPAQLAALPIPGGDTTSYAYSAPGVVLNSGAGYGNFSAYGLPSTANLFTTNGNDNMDPYLNLNNSGALNLTLGSNELQEVAVVSNGYSVQYGRQAGAQMNASTKSGGNAYHGNVLYWWNGRALNANDWFGNHTIDPSTGKSTPRPFANNNQWGASLGGPVMKNKLFFFVDAEGIRVALPGVSGYNYIPTQQFADYVLANVDTTTPGSLPFYQNIFNLYSKASGAPGTPVTAADDASLGCGDFAGTAGFGTTIPCAAKFVSLNGNQTNEWILATRVDYNINNDDRLFGRFKADHGVQATGTDAIDPVFNASSNQPAYEGQLSETHVFNGSTINSFLLAGSWYKALFGPADLSKALATFPTTMAFGDGLYTTLGGADNAYPQGRIVSQYEIIDDLSKSVGNHTLKFGINFRRNLVSDYAYGGNTSGSLNIMSMTEFVNGSQFAGADNYASYYSQAFANISAVRIKLYSMGLYAQDQWKASNKLSLTMGLRFDRNSNPACGTKCFARTSVPFETLNHDASLPYNQAIATGLGNAFASIEPFVFSPRVGAAYNIFPKTVLRGGFGMFTDLFMGTIVDRFITNAPNIATFEGGLNGGAPLALGVAGSVFDQAAASNAAFQSGFKNGATLADLESTVLGFSPPAYNAMGSKLLNPKFLEWNFEVERELAKNYTLSLNYVGNHGMDVMTDDPYVNAYCKTGHCPFGSITNSSAPDSRFLQVREITNRGWSNYHGLTASFKARVSKQIQGQLNYTWSHGMDTCSNNCLLPFVANTIASIRYQVTPNLPGLAYGASDYDVRHNINANYVYTSKEEWSTPALRYLLGGWQIAGTVFFHSGYPWTPISTAVRGLNLGNVTPLRNGTPLAAFAGTPQVFGGCGNPDIPCVTTSQFIDPSLQTNFGNYARNTLRGAGFFDSDLNVTKNFNLGERFKLGIGANFFNVFNHPNFDLPVNSYTAGNFGSIIATVTPATTPYGAFLGVPLNGRLVQLNGRLTF